MNIWQKICVAVGAVVIALMFLVFPSQKTVQIPNAGFGSVGKGYVYDNRYTSAIEIDYKNTALKAGGIAAATVAITLPLGLIRKGKERDVEA